MTALKDKKSWDKITDSNSTTALDDFLPPEWTMVTLRYVRGVATIASRLSERNVSGEFLQTDVCSLVNWLVSKLSRWLNLYHCNSKRLLFILFLIKTFVTIIVDKCPKRRFCDVKDHDENKWGIYVALFPTTEEKKRFTAVSGGRLYGTSGGRYNSCLKQRRIQHLPPVQKE